VHAYILLPIAAVANLAAVFCMKASDGMTKPWPTLGTAVAILLTQWLIARAMATGTSVSYAVLSVVVAVMVGSAMIGVLYGERVSPLQGLGYGLAVIGVVVAGVAGAVGRA
jgi:small multidrug resistance pump